MQPHFLLCKEPGGRHLCPGLDAAPRAVMPPTTRRSREHSARSSPRGQNRVKSSRLGRRRLVERTPAGVAAGQVRVASQHTLRSLPNVYVWQALATVATTPGGTEREADMRTNTANHSPGEWGGHRAAGTQSPGPFPGATGPASCKSDPMVPQAPTSHRGRGRGPSPPSL